MNIPKLCRTRSQGSAFDDANRERSRETALNLRLADFADVGVQMRAVRRTVPRQEQKDCMFRFLFLFYL